MNGGKDDGQSMEELRQRVEALTAEQNALLDKVLADMDNPELNARLKEASDEKRAVLERIQAMEQRAEQDAMRESRKAEMREWMGERNPQFTKYSETLTRRMIEKITVRDEETVSVRIRDTGDDILVHIDTDG